MVNRLYIKFLSLIINFIDSKNKNKIINFFKKKLHSQIINVIDVGAHKGETIDLFYNNFNINKIFAFEANPKIYESLKDKISMLKYQNKVHLFNFGIGEKKESKDLLIFNESSSSTYNTINDKSNYYKRKIKYLSLFNNKKNKLSKKLSTKIFPLSSIDEINNLQKIDILKIDTEGYEFNVLKGLNKNQFKNIKYIYFEHHYDLMIEKNYKYHDIKFLLNQNNFILSFKIKMNLRKTFEYIYENTSK
jgi:FkbM family methyltransferase